jgi:hypothetical protein
MAPIALSDSELGCVMALAKNTPPVMRAFQASRMDSSDGAVRWQSSCGRAEYRL